MKRIVTLIVLLYGFLAANAQDKFIRYREDPSYLYIKRYMPEYYYEGFLVEGNPKMNASFGANSVSVRVRVLRNHKDNKTFTYLLLRCGNEYETLFVQEVDPLISYLERIILLFDQKPEDHNYYVFNSYKGIYFNTKWTETATSIIPRPPYYELNVFFPKGETFKFTSKKQIQNLIFKLDAAKQYFPPSETDFLRGEDIPEFEWEIEDVKGNLV